MVNSLRLSIFLTLVLFVYSTALLAAVSINDLETEIGKRLDRVREFKAMQEYAKELGIKELYLFGGTASAWAHYVYLDLRREDGEFLYKERFDYDYTSIFRKNQDIDIVIRGSAQQAELLENKLKEKFPFFQGNRSVFEVRLYDQNRGDKEALTNLNFLNQNTDSHSIGLVKVVGNGERVTEIKVQGHTESYFLKDIYNHTIHYFYDHEKHLTTKRYLEKKNPEILSVIRYLIKVFQFELMVRSEDEKEIRSLISSFDPSSIASMDSYVSSWLEKNAPKLFQNAMSIEAAWNTLELLDFRKKLMAINHNEKVKGSLSWWMNKEPLRSKEVGLGDGPTAKELGITEISHETRDFDSYESITKSYDGTPNILSSRKTGAAGEHAVHGDGFYTMKGHQGGIGTNQTIHFLVDPKARLNSDFEIFEDDIVLVKNRQAILYVPESLKFDMVTHFRLLVDGVQYFDESNVSVFAQIKRRFDNAILLLTDKERDTIYHILKDNVLTLHNSKLIVDYLQVMRLDQKNLDLILSFFKNNNDHTLPEILNALFLRKEFHGKNATYYFDKVYRSLFTTKSLELDNLIKPDLMAAAGHLFHESNREIYQQLMRRLENSIVSLTDQQRDIFYGLVKQKMNTEDAGKVIHSFIPVMNIDQKNLKLLFDYLKVHNFAELPDVLNRLFARTEFQGEDASKNFEEVYAFLLDKNYISLSDLEKIAYGLTSRFKYSLEKWANAKTFFASKAMDSSYLPYLITFATEKQRYLEIALVRKTDQLLAVKLFGYAALKAPSASELDLNSVFKLFESHVELLQNTGTSVELLSLLREKLNGGSHFLPPNFEFFIKHGSFNSSLISLFAYRLSGHDDLPRWLEMMFKTKQWTAEAQFIDHQPFAHIWSSATSSLFNRYDLLEAYLRPRLSNPSAALLTNVVSVFNNEGWRPSIKMLKLVIESVDLLEIQKGEREASNIHGRLGSILAKPVWRKALGLPMEGRLNYLIIREHLRTLPQFQTSCFKSIEPFLLLN